MNLKRGVRIDHCHKKEGNKVENMYLPALLKYVKKQGGKHAVSYHDSWVQH